MSKKTEQLILQELRAIRALLERQAPPQYTLTPSIYTTTNTGSYGTWGGGAGGGPPPDGGVPAYVQNPPSSSGGGAQVDIQWDPGADRLQEMINNPDGELARQYRTMPVTEETVHAAIDEAIKQHDENLLRALRTL
jgi:hypothetical protein